MRHHLLQPWIAREKWSTIAAAARVVCAAGLLGCASTPSPTSHVVVPENAAHAVVVPFNLAGGWILVRVVVNGDTGSLVLDTGADWTGLDRSWAKAVGARYAYPHPRAAPNGSADDPFASASWALVDTIQFGGGLQLARYWIVLQSGVSALSEAGGRLVRGYLGQDVLQQFTVEIDYEARLLRLYDPLHYRYSGSGVIIPFANGSRRPIVQSILVTEGGDSIKARLRLDTGGSHACVILNTPFVEQHKVREMLTPTIEGSQATSLDGPLRVFVGGASELRFGDLTIDSPTVVLGGVRKGFLSDSTYDGTVGHSVFHGGRLILDYARRRAIVEPRTSLGRDCAYDGSGVTLTALGPTFKRFRVRYVLPHSPGADAGVQPGDELVSLDGRPAADLDLEDIRQALMADGAVRRLRLARGADTTVVTLTLRRLF